MSALARDLRYSVRMLLRSPGTTGMAILMLALGLGANTAGFSFVNALFLRPLDLPEPEQIVRVYGATEDGSRFDVFSYANYEDLRDRNQVFEELAAHQNVTISLGDEGAPQLVDGEVVTGNYFELLRVPPQLGRLLQPADDVTIGGHPVAVIGKDLWQRRYGGSPDILGTLVRINGHPFTIVGVAPASFRGTFEAFRAEVWVPMAMHEQARPRGIDLRQRGWGWLSSTGRLRPGIGLDTASADLGRLAQNLEAEHPLMNDGFRVELFPATALPEQFRDGASAFLGFFLLVVGLVLAITCANLASILLARVASRQQEIAVRRSLGAGRLALLRQWMIESLMLALLGGAAGVLLALWIKDGILTLVPPEWSEFAPNLQLDGRVLGFSVLAALATGALFGLIPALRAGSVQVMAPLNEQSGSITGKNRFFGLSVTAQVTLSLMMLVVAGLFLRSLQTSEAFDPGFDSDRLLVGSVSLARHGYTEAEGRDFYRRALERLNAAPGVESASTGLVVPLGSGRETLGFVVEGVEPPDGRGTTPIPYNVVGPDYFRTMGIPVLRGREFEERDAREGANPVVVVNETLARTFWPGQEPLGKTLGMDGTMLTVIGVARDIKYYSLGEAPQPYVYGSSAQFYFDWMTFHLRTASDPAALLSVLRAAIQETAPELAMQDVMTLQQMRRIPLFPYIAVARVSGLFGALALALTGLGIYGIVSYSVNHRVREIGVRMALGACRTDIFRTVIGGVMAFALAGMALGLAGVVAVSSLLTDLLFGITPLDPLTYGGVSLLLGTVALVAAYLPARRAAGLDPMVTLRYE